MCTTFEVPSLLNSRDLKRIHLIKAVGKGLAIIVVKGLGPSYVQG